MLRTCHAELQRRGSSLKQKCLIGKVQRVAMHQVDFHLCQAFLVNQSI